MATHSSVLAWRIPGMGEPDGPAVYGVAQSCTRLKRLSSSSSSSIYTSMLLSQLVLPLSFNTWMAGQFGRELIHVHIWSSPFVVPLKLPENYLLLRYVVVHSLNCVCLQPHEFSMPRFPVFLYHPEFVQTHVNWVSDAIQSSHPLSPPFPQPLMFPRIRVFSNESALVIDWLKYWSFSFSISPSNEYSGLIFFRIDWFHLLAVQGALESLLQHHSSKAPKFFGAQPSLQSNSHTQTWLLEKPQLWLCRPLLAKQCLCFLIHCLVLL